MQMIVKRGITLGYALEFIVEVDYDLAKRHIERHLHAVAGYVFLLHEYAALRQAEGHYQPMKSATVMIDALMYGSSI